MREQISVNKAIKRGHLIVNVPVFIALYGCPAIALYLSNENLIPGWGIGIAFLLGFVLAWIIWSYMITKWRIWAFENVRNVHVIISAKRRHHFSANGATFKRVNL